MTSEENLRILEEKKKEKERIANEKAERKAAREAKKAAQEANKAAKGAILFSDPDDDSLESEVCDEVTSESTGVRGN